VCRGICAMDLRTMEVKTYAADAVIFATGGNGVTILRGGRRNSVVCTGSAQAALFQQGRGLRERRIHSSASYRRFLVKTSCY